MLIAEWRDSRPRGLYYWLAAIVVRTAATNLADSTGHQFGDLIALGGVALVLLGTVVVRGRNALRLGAGPNDLPKVDARYWVTMRFVGILGTGLGDCSAFHLHLGLANGSLILSALVVAFGAMKLIFSISAPIYY